MLRWKELKCFEIVTFCRGSTAMEANTAVWTTRNRYSGLIYVTTSPSFATNRPKIISILRRQKIKKNVITFHTNNLDLRAGSQRLWALFNWESKVICNYTGVLWSNFPSSVESYPIWIGFDLLRSVIGPVNQSDAKLKPIASWSPTFSRALGSLLAFTWCFHWFFKGIFLSYDWPPLWQLWFGFEKCSTSRLSWSGKIAPLSRPVRCKTEKNCNLFSRIYLRFRRCAWFSFEISFALSRVTSQCPHT